MEEKEKTGTERLGEEANNCPQGPWLRAATAAENKACPELPGDETEVRTYRFIS